jgi:very-short-patch-repair endonuclease
MTADWWAAPPGRHVSYLSGAAPELLRLALDPLPVAAPAIIQFRPARGGRIGDQIEILLSELDRVAIELFPHWLPGAELLDGPHDLGIQAVRALARDAAGRSQNFGPFLADLAVRGLRGSGANSPRLGGGARLHGEVRFPAEVRAPGLSRVIASAYGRESTVLLIELPPDLSPSDEQNLVAGAEWLAHHGQFTVWLAGAPLLTVDRLRTVPITMPPYYKQLLTEATEAAETVEAADDGDGASADRVELSAISYPPLAGVPRKDSPAECALERALSKHEWAQGRSWNHTFERNLLAKTYRLDLFWAAERLIIEVDGADHRERLKFADDHNRDVRLHLLEYVVLRFTNEQVLADVGTVLFHIKQLLSTRRAESAYISK